MSSSKSQHTLRSTLPSSLTAYHDFIQQVLDQLLKLNWQEQERFGVHLALEESISNAIRHGNQLDPNKEVHVECRLDSDRFWAQICDEGQGYEPDQVPDCCCEENLEVPGGRGLTLIRAYMTSVELNDQGNCLTIEKRLEPSSPPLTPEPPN